MYSSPPFLLKEFISRYAALVTALVCLGASSVSAQRPPVNYVQSNIGLSGFHESAGIRIRTPKKRGIKAGEFLVWPSLILEGRWDSNLFQTDKDDGVNGDVRDAAVLRVVPGLAFSNPNPNKIAVSLGAETDIRLYLSSDEFVKKQRDFAAKADLRLDFLPKGPVSFTLLDKFRRTIHTRNFASISNYNVNTNQSSALISIHPGGRALDISLGYSFIFNKFDDFEDFDSQSQLLRLLMTWRFYPKTTALLEVSGQLRDWDNDGTDNDGVNQSAQGLGGADSADIRAVDAFVDSKPVRAYLGLNGFFTKKLSMLLKIGYGDSFHDSGESFAHVIGQGEIGFKFTNSVLLAAGFQRDFNDSFYGNYYVDNRSYLRLQAHFAKRVTLDVSGKYTLRDFAEHNPAVTAVFISHRERRDQIVGGHARVEVDLTRWLSMTLGYEMEQNFTNFRVEHDIPLGGGQIGKFVDVGKFSRHQVYGSVNVQY